VYVERRHIDFVVRRVDQMTSSQINRKFIRETIRKDLEINELDRYMELVWIGLFELIYWDKFCETVLENSGKQLIAYKK